MSKGGVEKACLMFIGDLYFLLKNISDEHITQLRATNPAGMWLVFRTVAGFQILQAVAQSLPCRQALSLEMLPFLPP